MSLNPTPAGGVRGGFRIRILNTDQPVNERLHSNSGLTCGFRYEITISAVPEIVTRDGTAWELPIVDAVYCAGEPASSMTPATAARTAPQKKKEEIK